MEQRVLYILGVMAMCLVGPVFCIDSESSLPGIIRTRVSSGGVRTLVRDSDFEEILQHSEVYISVFMFVREDCSSCNEQYFNMYRKMAETFPSFRVYFYRVLADETPLTNERYHINNFPSYLFFKKSHLVKTLTGPQDLSTLLQTTMSLIHE